MTEAPNSLYRIIRNMNYEKIHEAHEFREMGEYAKIHYLMNELNKYPIKTNSDENIRFHNDFYKKFK